MTSHQHFMREVGVLFHLDTNRINAYGKLEYVNQLEIWSGSGVVVLELSEAAQREGLAGANQTRHRKVYDKIVALDQITTRVEVLLVRGIAEILFPGKELTDAERNDVLVVFNACKYGAILVTADGASKRQPTGILGNRDKLKDLGARVMTDEEAVQYVRKRIAVRDDNARRSTELTGEALPDWVGMD